MNVLIISLYMKGIKNLVYLSVNVTRPAFLILEPGWIWNRLTIGIKVPIYGKTFSL